MPWRPEETPTDAQVAALRDEIASLRHHFHTRMDQQMIALDDIQNKVANVTGAMNSMITFQKLLAQELKDALANNNQAKMTAIANELDNDASIMAASVLTNPDPGATITGGGTDTTGGGTSTVPGGTDTTGGAVDTTGGSVSVPGGTDTVAGADTTGGAVDTTGGGASVTGAAFLGSQAPRRGPG